MIHLKDFGEVKAMATKSRLLSLLKLLQENSDEHCPLTTAQIRKALLEEGFPASIESRALNSNMFL